MSEKRRRAAHRPRRILFNNDGNDLRCLEVTTAEGFLNCRTSALADSQVDAIFYCTHHSFNRCTHDTAVGEVSGPWGASLPADGERTLRDRGRDCLQIITDFCHEHGMEAFCSMRMNDVHDGKMPHARSQFKKDKPGLLLGVEGDHEGHVGEARWWSGVDYERAEVRERAFRLVEDVCRGHDVDGVELDFLRHPVFFKRTREGLPARPRHSEMMTDLMRRVHAMSVHAGEVRGRPVLVAVRVPDTVRICLHLGLDVETWLREGLVDIVVAGGYVHLAPWEEMIELGHAHGVPVYPCISASRLRCRVAQPLERELLLWRGEALGAWGAGADGLYLFNHFEDGPASFLRNADADWLRELPRVYAPNPGVPEKWLGRELAAGFGLLPLSVAEGEAREATLYVNEEVSVGAGTEVSLRVRLSRLADADSVKVAFNGAPVPALRASPLSGRKISHCEVLGMPGIWVECPLEPAALKRGGNRVAVQCRRWTGAEPLEFQDVQLEVRPRREIGSAD